MLIKINRVGYANAVCFYINFIISSITNTTAQEDTATPNKLTPRYESTTPVTSAAMPDQILSVA